MCSVSFFRCHLRMIILCAVFHFPLSENDNMNSVALFHCHLRINLTMLHFYNCHLRQLHFFNSHLPMIFLPILSYGLPY